MSPDGFDIFNQVLHNGYALHRAPILWKDIELAFFLCDGRKLNYQVYAG
jgi:hypothetical protein